MSAKGCSHLQHFKQNDNNLESFRWIHSVFVVGSPARSQKLRLTNSYCRTCRNRGPYLHACLECVFFGCHRHIREHGRLDRHTISVDLVYGQVHCFECNDYVYDADIDAITTENKMRAGKFKKRLFDWTSWDPTEEERHLLEHRTKKICVTPQSTVGLRGLVNLGSTCYMNCVVQALMHTPLLRDYFLTVRHMYKGGAGTTTTLLREISKLFQEFYRGDCVPVATDDILYLLWQQAPHLRGNKQQDAHEFFMATLDILHQDCLVAVPHLRNRADDDRSAERNGGDGVPHVSGKNCKCIVHQLFTGGLQSDVVCQNCKGVSTTIELISDFPLDLGPVTSLIDCLDKFTRPEHLASQIFCERCKSYEKSTKQLTLKTLPIVISFHLKRFQQTLEKISTAIAFPESLDMTPFMSGNHVLRPEPQPLVPPDNRYSLFAVINHVGATINSGHFTAFVRQQQDSWYKCDDEVITRASLGDVLNSEGYMLFYHKEVLEYE